MPESNGRFFFADLWSDDDSKIGTRKVNVTVGYPSLVPIDLGFTTAHMVSAIHLNECEGCRGQKFSGGRSSAILNSL